MARAISDIAAMGGTPKFAMVTVALSPETEFARVKSIYSGLRKAAGAFGIDIVGGETARSPGPMFLSIALTGIVDKSRCVLRSGGRVGDLLYVTGRLGGSIRGKHLSFTPRLKEGQWLAKNFLPSAMMDLSDGLGADLPRLARASKAGFVIHPESLPLNPGCTPENALRDGEDFELLFAIHPKKAVALETAWKKHFPKLTLTQIGNLTRQSKQSLCPPQPYGFDHFA
jgi:thiamine-monophosphate kinase